MENLINTREAASRIGAAVNTITNWRRTGYGPGFIKSTDARGRVFYDPAVIDAWKLQALEVPRLGRKLNDPSRPRDGCDEETRFRLPSELLEKARKQARLEGCSLSELFRITLSRMLGGDS